MMDIDICDQLKFCVIESVRFGNYANGNSNYGDSFRNSNYGDSFRNSNYGNSNYAISYNIFIGISY